MSPLPSEWRGQAAVAYKSKVYLFGGASAADSALNAATDVDRDSADPATLYNDTLLYDPVSDQWSRRKDMLVGLYVLTGHALNDKVYLFGGYNNSGFVNAVQVYDPPLDSWAMAAPMPTKRYIFVSEALNGKVYIIGGRGPDPTSTETNPAWPYSDKVEIFDPQTGWSTGEASPHPIAGAASCTLGERIFTFGGEASNLTSIYDVKADRWSVGTPPPLSRNGHACVRIGAVFFVIGGRDPEGWASRSVQKYDPASDTWEPYERMSAARYWFASAGLEDTIYVFGGEAPRSDSIDAPWGLLPAAERLRVDAP